MMHSRIRHSGISDCDPVQHSAQAGIRFADAVNDAGYTTALGHPAATLNFAGTESYSVRRRRRCIHLRVLI
jgi:hypothetical protein